MKKIVNILAWVLVLIGALNWGLVGVFDFNLVETLFGAGTIVTKVIYILVGIAALWIAFLKLMKKKN